MKVSETDIRFSVYVSVFKSASWLNMIKRQLSLLKVVSDLTIIDIIKEPASAKIPNFCINLTSNSAEKAHRVGVGCGLKTAVAMK